LKNDILYYNKMMGISYKECKNIYFGEVGR